jgi:polyhydroxyalkanoate synthesis regulator phasin
MMAEKRDLSNIPYLAVGALVAVQEEIEKAAERLIEKGKSLTPEGRKKMASTKKGLVSKGDEFSTVVARTVQRALENTGIVTHSDLDGIEKRVTVIEKKVAKRKKPSAKKPATKKTAAKKSAAKKPAAKKKAANKEQKAIKALLDEPGHPPAGSAISELVPRRPTE